MKVLFDGVDLIYFKFWITSLEHLNLVYSLILILFAMVVECSASSSEHNFDKKTNFLVYYFVENLLSTQRPTTDHETLKVPYQCCFPL